MTKDELAIEIYRQLYPPVTKAKLLKAYENGLIPKGDLEVGATYIGRCRNATEAIWDGKLFNYERNKFGHKFKEDIVCPEDDVGFDIFVAVGIK
jgi:hypothetical protein